MAHTKFPFYGPKCMAPLPFVEDHEAASSIRAEFANLLKIECQLPKGHEGAHYDFRHRNSAHQRELYWVGGKMRRGR